MAVTFTAFVNPLAPPAPPLGWPVGTSSCGGGDNCQAGGCSCGGTCFSGGCGGGCSGGSCGGSCGCECQDPVHELCTCDFGSDLFATGWAPETGPRGTPVYGIGGPPSALDQAQRRLHAAPRPAMPRLNPGDVARPGQVNPSQGHLVMQTAPPSSGDFDARPCLTYKSAGGVVTDVASGWTLSYQRRLVFLAGVPLPETPVTLAA